MYILLFFLLFGYLQFLLLDIEVFQAELADLFIQGLNLREFLLDLALKFLPLNPSLLDLRLQSLDCQSLLLDLTIQLLVRGLRLEDLVSEAGDLLFQLGLKLVSLFLHCFQLLLDLLGESRITELVCQNKLSIIYFNFDFFFLFFNYSPSFKK